MILRRGLGIVLIVVVSGLFWTGYVKLQVSQICASDLQKKELAKELAQEIQKPAYYKLQEVKEGLSIPAAVYFEGKKILTFTQQAGGLTPRERASAFVNKLNNFVENQKNPNKIFPGFNNGIAVALYENEVLFTADVKSAKSLGLSVSELAFLWTSSVRKALGSTELLNDYELLKQLAEKAEFQSIYEEIGIASWYGGYFHGRTAADGSTYNMYEFTAAHKSLPFGSIVKVTNLRNNGSCIVKITDRGPFIEGRIIDLSKVAAQEIGMLGSGTSKVKIEVLGRV